LVDIAKERARIARELHDGIAQDLAAIGYALDSEIGRSDTNPNSREALRAIREQLTNLNSAVRAEIFRLRSERADEPQAALEALLQSCDIDFSIAGALPGDETGLELGKILQELTRNSIEHGAAKTISIDIKLALITFENDGTSSAPSRDARFGLIGIAERLADIGWELTSSAGFNQIEIRPVP
jgi:signal transduction histidine kinase